MLGQNGQILFALFLSFAVPVIMILARKSRERKAIKVTAIVTKIEEVQNNDGPSSYYPSFEVAAGPHKGIRYRCHWDCGPSIYVVGGHYQANLFPETGEIYGEKRTNREWLTWFTPFYIILGFLIINKIIGVK